MRWNLAARLYTLTDGDATPILVPAMSTHSFDIGDLHRYSTLEAMPVDTDFYDLGAAEFSAIPLLNLGDFDGKPCSDRPRIHGDVMRSLLTRWKRPRIQTVQWNQLVFDDIFLQTVKSVMKGLDGAWVDFGARTAIVEGMLVAYLQGRLG